MFTMALQVDLISHMARYVLQMWRKVLQHEDRNMTDWYNAGLAAARWVARQQNPEDGGLPNRIALQPTDNWDDPGTPSASVVSGRSLSGLPTIVTLTNDTRVGALSPALSMAPRLWAPCASRLTPF